MKLPLISDDYGQTGLHFAAIKSHFELAMILIRRGADYNLKDKVSNILDDLLALQYQ
jgi:ankyrin repeat protein